MRTAHDSSAPPVGVSSIAMLVELLALHEEMVLQLELERMNAVVTAEFLAAMIQQHRKAAFLLRAQLENHDANPEELGVAFATEDTTSAGRNQSDKIDTDFADGPPGARHMARNCRVATPPS